MKSNKLLYGFLAFGPILVALLGVLVMVLAIAQDPEAHEPPAMVFVSFGLFALAGLVGLLGMIMYLIHVGKNPALDNDTRIGWIIGMVMVHGVITIVYYFLYIVKDVPPLAPAAPANEWDKRLQD